MCSEETFHCSGSEELEMAVPVSLILFYFI